MSDDGRWICLLTAVAFVALVGTALAKPPVGFTPPGQQSRGPNQTRGPFSFGTTFGAASGHAQVGLPAGCDATMVTAAKADIDAACPCAGTPGEPDGMGAPTVMPWRNHGQYVSCIARARSEEARSMGISIRCLADVVPCAAQSTCGKTDDVACITMTPGVCMGDGTCDTDPTAPCVDDSQCPPQSSCAMMTGTDCDNVPDGVTGLGTCCSQ